MKLFFDTRYRNINSAGFTLLELIVVVIIIGIMSALAVPPYLSWRQGMEYRKVTQNIVGELRETRSRAITTNAAQTMTFDFVNKTYSVVGKGLHTIDQVVSLASVTGTSLNVSFNPNGTSSGGTVFIQDNTGTPRYTVSIDPTGKVSVFP